MLMNVTTSSETRPRQAESHSIHALGPSGWSAGTRTQQGTRTPPAGEDGELPTQSRKGKSRHQHAGTPQDSLLPQGEAPVPGLM